MDGTGMYKFLLMYVLFFLNLSTSDAGALSSTRSTHEENIDVIWICLDMLSSHVKGWRCGKLMSIQQIAKPVLCFNQDYYSQQQKWMFKSISRCFTWCSSNAPASWPHVFVFVYLNNPVADVALSRFKQFISSGALEVKSNKSSKCNKYSCITQVHRYTLLKINGWNPNMKVWKII